MLNTATLATRFSPNTRVLRGDTPLSEDSLRQAAPSIFAAGKHISRSDRYTYIPTIEVLRSLRSEGFQPFLAAQSRSRIERKTQYTKHMARIRHSDQIRADAEVNAIILIYSQDGASSYQLLAGAVRDAACNCLL